MRIAIIAPIIERVPPKKYGGTERVVHELTEELVRRGHEVTLFASGNSLTKATLESVYPGSLREARLKDIYGLNIWSLINMGVAYQRQDEFDIIHDHVGFVSAATAELADTPVVMTMHGAFTLEVREIFNRFRKANLVTISNSQSYPAPGLNYVGMVPNGLSMKDYPFSVSHEGYLLFVGRISAEKGVHHAIEAAQQLNMPLIIAAKLDPTDKPYFVQHIEPMLSEDIRWIGEVDEETRNELMSKTYCFLHPVTWREPFGLTLIEAMACGCPVVAFDKGSIPEIIENGRTGFVVQDIDSMVDAVKSIDSIDREYCRQYVLENFSTEKMVDGYEEIYRHLVQNRSKNSKKKRNL